MTKEQIRGAIEKFKQEVARFLQDLGPMIGGLIAMNLGDVIREQPEEKK